MQERRSPWQCVARICVACADSENNEYFISCRFTSDSTIDSIFWIMRGKGMGRKGMTLQRDLSGSKILDSSLHKRMNRMVFMNISMERRSVRCAWYDNMSHSSKTMNLRGNPSE